MSKQPEALRLAEKLDERKIPSKADQHGAAAELRRLHAVNAEMVAELEEIVEWARVEKSPLRPQEVASIKRVLAKAGAAS